MPKIIAEKKDWLSLGFKLFAENGVSGIVVEKMAKKLKCNKSSFYWHFKTKKDFINQLVAHWVFTETEQIIFLTNQEVSTLKKLERLVKITYKKTSTLDFIFYLKRYAIKEKSIQKIIDKIDRQRIDYVSMLLQEFGYSLKDAVIKAEILYKHLIGYHEMIRYKKQSKNYLSEVIQELAHFINFKNQ